MDVQSAKNFAKLDGLIGLAPDDPTNGPSFASELHSQDVVDSKIVSIDLNYPPGYSRITFGGIDDDVDEDQIRYYDQINNKKWELKVEDIYVGNHSVHDNKTTGILIDTFFRPILLTNDSWD